MMGKPVKFLLNLLIISLNDVFQFFQLQLKGFDTLFTGGLCIQCCLMLADIFLPGTVSIPYRLRRRMEELNSTLEVFHRLARKYRTQPELLKAEYETWQTELEQLHQLEDPETLAEQVAVSYQDFLEKAQHLEQIRREAAAPLAKQLTEQVKQLALPEAHFEFKFEALEQPSSEGLSFIQLLFTANKGIPAQPLARVASGGELSRIALVMQVMNAEKTEAEVLVFDEIDVGISGGTAEIVGRLLAGLAQHVQILCITHQAQSQQYLQYFLSQLAWQHDEVRLFGKHYVTARKVVWYGDAHYQYRYSGTLKQAQLWTPGLLRLKQHIEQLVKF